MRVKRVKYALCKINGEPRVSFNREELEVMLRSAIEEEEEEGVDMSPLVLFLEQLEALLIAIEGTY